MPPISQGQTFHSLSAFKEALRDWAIERNWTPHILDSDKHRVRAGCRSSPDCPFRIRCNYGAKKGIAKVTTCDDRHTCDPFRASAEGKAHQDIKRAETGKLKFLLEVTPKLINVTLDTHVLEIVEAIERKYGQKIPTRQAQKVKAGLTDRVKGPCRHCHQLGHTRRQCPQLRASAPGPMDFSNLQQEGRRFASGDEDEDTYVDGGLEEEGGNEGVSGHSVDFGGTHQPNCHDQLFASAQPQPMSNQTHMQQGLNSNGFVNLPPNIANNGVDPNVHGLPRDYQPVQERSAIVQNPRTIAHSGISQNTQTISPSGISQIPQTITQPGMSQNPQAITQPGIPQNPQGFHQSEAMSNQRTPTETRLEAAKMMQQAARLMQEAARLNNEAARLTASVATQ